MRTFAASADERESSLIWALRLDWEGVEDMVVCGESSQLYGLTRGFERFEFFSKGI